MGQSERVLKRASRFHQTIHQSHLQRFFSLYAASGQYHIERMALSDQARQTDGAEVNEWNTKAPVEDAKHGVTSSNAQVAPQSEFQSAGHGMTFDCRENRLAQQHPGRSHERLAFRINRLAATSGNLAQI